MNHDTKAKSVRARAARACSSCHTRKVRCDVFNQGRPCSQCSESGFRCEVNERKKRRKKSFAHPTNGPNLSKTTDPKPFPEHMMLHRVPFYPLIQNLAPSGRANLCCKETEQGIVLPITGESPNGLAEEDMQFLKLKGALDLPDKELLDECVANYFDVFHAFFPIIDQSDFLKQYHESNCTRPSMSPALSLLLLQGIIFTACSLVPSSVIQRMGFTSRQKARNCFHRRARYLYEFDYEKDDICVIQTLLLMSQHYSSMIEQKHTWFWLYQAIGLAQGAGLHHRMTNASVAKTKLWKRLWWACIVRDRLVALGTGRPAHIRNADCSTSSIEMTDLEEDGDTHEQRSVKAIFADFTRLCWIMEDILTATVSPISPDRRNACVSMLSEWHRSTSQPAEFHNDADSAHRFYTLYRIVIQLIYNINLIVLHQSGRLISEPPSAAQRIAVDSASLCAKLMEMKLEAICPSICVTAALPPIIVHILTIISNPGSSIADNHQHYFSMCMDFLERLGNIYWHAEFYHEFLRLTTGYTLASVRESSKPGAALQDERALQTSVENTTALHETSVDYDIQHLSRDMTAAPLTDQPVTAPEGGELSEDSSMLAHADQIFQQWLAGDTNWLEEYTTLYNTLL